jgi:hypothetical protein
VEIFAMAFSRFFDLLLSLVICGFEILHEVVACDDSYQCRFGQQCCKETNTCQASCSKSHETNIGVIIGIVAAVALGNALFWVTFCCLCWCKGSRKSRFRYRSFGENEDAIGPNNDDDVIDDDMIVNNDMINNKEVIDNGRVITDDPIDDDIIDDNETSKVLGIKDDSRREEISLSIIKIKRPILKTKRAGHELGESSTGNSSNI